MEFTAGFTLVGGGTFVAPPPPPPQEFYLWSWGSGGAGRLGLGDATNRSSPVQIGALSTWATIEAAGEHSLAIKTDGTLWSWGYNSRGQLGDGTGGSNTHKSSPVQIGALTTWLKIAGGRYHSMAIKTDGTLWAWGGNFPPNYGQLGLGDTTNRSSPTQVGALTNWLSVVAGEYHSMAVKTDGTMWSWGKNNLGQLGLGNTTDISSPVQIGAGTTWSSIAGYYIHSAAIKTDGTLWSWGDNSYGNLGLGNTTNRSSPVQVGALTTWSKVYCGQGYSMAVKTDGTLWSWGHNFYGNLGLGDSGTINNRSSPVQVGALTTWSSITTGGLLSAAIKTDGSLWTWGLGIDGGLGLGNTTARSSPVQVGSSTTWYSVAARAHTLAITN